jgi:hypothetical protein
MVADARTEGGRVGALLEVAVEGVSDAEVLGDNDADTEDAVTDGSRVEPVVLAELAPEDPPVQPASGKDSSTSEMPATSVDHFINNASPRRVDGNDQPTHE